MTLLRKAYAQGGSRGVRAAFPERRWGQLGSALRRYVTGIVPTDDPVSLPSRDQVRERIRSIPAEQFVDGVIRLLTRREDFVSDYGGLERLRESHA